MARPSARPVLAAQTRGEIGGRAQGIGDSHARQADGQTVVEAEGAARLAARRTVLDRGCHLIADRR
jgi:hypothetical protein